MCKDVEAGLFLSDALARHPKVFGQLYVAMVRAGEAGGVLEECLNRVADQLEKDAALRRQVRAAMIYPAVIISFAVIVLLALVAFLIPVFEGVFKTFPGKMPPADPVHDRLLAPGHRAVVSDAGRVHRQHVVGSSSSSAPSGAEPRWDALKLRFPMKIGDVVQKVAIARWSRTLSLADHGRRADPAGHRDHGQDGRQRRHRGHDGRRHHLGQGRRHASLSRCAGASAFPAMVSQMVGVGEETGALDTMLEKVADFYDSEVEAAVKALTSIMEPVMIIVVGGIVGVIVISMYMPLFSIYNSIK